MGKKGKISLEGYRKNSPDKHNDFNIIPSQYIDMHNVDHDVLMIPMGGRGTGNPVLAKPGEQYFFPNHDFVFEQAMPENAIMRYQRIAKAGGMPQAKTGYELAQERMLKSFQPSSSSLFTPIAPVQFPVHNYSFPIPTHPGGFYVPPGTPYPLGPNRDSAYRDPYSGWDGTGAPPLYTESNRPDRTHSGGMYFTPEELSRLPLDPGFDVYPKRTGPGPIRWPEVYGRSTGVPWPTDRPTHSGGIRNPNGPGVINPVTNRPYTWDEFEAEGGWEKHDPEAWQQMQNVLNQLQSGNWRNNPNIIVNKYGGGLPKAQMYNSQVNVPLNTNDFIYTPQELEKYKNIYDQRIATCQKGDAACLEQANNYYNLYIAPKLGSPNIWQMSEKMGISSGKGNPRMKDYGIAADSWDYAGASKKAGAKINLAAPIKDPDEIQKKLAGMSEEELKNYWTSMNLPLGALVNFGQAGLSEHYGKGQAYNVSQGLVPSNHSARVVGYSPEGVPYIYDYGKVTPITDPTFKSMPLTIITSPQEIQGYTFENLKKQGKLEGSKMTPLNIKTKGADYDPDEYEPFITSLQKNKDMYANALGMSDEEYNNYAKHAAALALTETGGGDDTAIRWKGIIPVPSYVSDKLGFGDTKGITQINPDVLFGKKSLANKLETLGIRKDNYDPWNPDHAAIATMALLKDNKSVQDKYAKTAGNKADLSEAEKTYYQWSMPRTLRKGEAKGESEKIKRYLENFAKIQADFDSHNRYLAQNRKHGGPLPMAQAGLSATSTYLSGKEQNTKESMSDKRRAYEQNVANAIAARDLQNARKAMTAAGMVFYPIGLVNAALDFSEGNYGNAALSAFPWFKMAKGATQGGAKLAYGNIGAISALKDAGDITDGAIYKNFGGDISIPDLTDPYKKGGTKEKPSTIYVEDPNDPRLKAYNDSLYVRTKHSQKFTPGNKTRPLTVQEKKFWKDEETGLVPYLVEYDPDYPSSGYYGHYKKPVQPYEYRKPEESKEEVKQETKKQVSPKSDYKKQWNFSGPSPVLEYKDNTGNVVKTETYTSSGPAGKLVEPIINQYPFGGMYTKTHTHMETGGWLDQYKKGGRLPGKHETNKNIKSSINYLMRRNETLFGPPGRNFYNPNPMSKYYKGGIAFPQQPTAGSTPGKQESEFYSPNWIPPGPVGFYEDGGIAYPQQPTPDYFFSGAPWMPQYFMGGLPGGANNMPCYECGGNYANGGLPMAQPGMNFTPMSTSDSLAVTKYMNSPGFQAQYGNYNLNLERGKKYDTLTKTHKKSGKESEVTGWEKDPVKRAALNEYLIQQQMQSGQPVTGTPYFANTYNQVQGYKPLAKNMYGGYEQKGGFMNPDNMMNYPIFSQGGDPYEYEDGGNILGLDQDQIVRTFGNNFLSGVEGNLQNNIAREAGQQFLQNPYGVPQAQDGYNMNFFNQYNENNANQLAQMEDMYANIQDQQRGAGQNLWNTGMFAATTANPYTKWKAKKMGSGTLPEAKDGYTGRKVPGMPELNLPASNVPQLNFPSSRPQQAQTNPDAWMSPEAQAKKKAFYDAAAAYDQKWAQPQGGYNPYMQGQFAPGYQTMYDMLGNDDYRVGHMSRGMRNMLPYLMFNPQNTYLQEFKAKKALFGPGARKVSMKFRTVFDPRTGQQVQVPADQAGTSTSGSKSKSESAGSTSQKQGAQTQPGQSPFGAGFPAVYSAPENPAYPYGTPPAGTTFDNNMAYAPAQAGYPTMPGYNFNAQLGPAVSQGSVFPQNPMVGPRATQGIDPQEGMFMGMPKEYAPKGLHMMGLLQQKARGGSYDIGVPVELTEEEIQQIMAAGGSVTYID